MSKHTPGPWTLVQDGGWPFAYTVESESANCWVVRLNLFTYSTDDTKEKANARLGNEVIHADARLIAAAPDLLAFATFFVEMFNGDPESPIDQAQLEQARAAIAKATGEAA